LRRTKIVCTIGPACDSPEILREMLKSGMNVARLNLSHGTHEQHARYISVLRKVAGEAGKNLAILLDTKGPEIRVGELKGKKVVLKEGAEVVLTVEKIKGNAAYIPISYEGLPADVKRGDTVLLNDGLITLRVIETKNGEIRCTVVSGGELAEGKGVNVPGVVTGLPCPTEKDVQDIIFGVEKHVDIIAASFIRKAADVLAIREVIEEKGGRQHIISKIENRRGVENLEEIIDVSDGIMVARGDLGVEIPPEEVPLVQKKIIRKCNEAGKPVITATQMLESMIHNSRPTRAEASDVANAILDGTDAVMLSGETALGKYPVEAVKTMVRIAEQVESALFEEEVSKKTNVKSQHTVTDAISRAVCSTARILDAAAIITSTQTGYTARMVAKHRPEAPVVAVTPSPEVLRRLAVVWGVQPLLIGKTDDTDTMISRAIEVSLAAGVISAGDLVVITAGVPVGVHGTTNLIKVHTVGDVLACGIGAGAGKAVTGRLRVARTLQEALGKVRSGDILVTPSTDKEYMPVLEKVAAVITETGGLTSHAVIVGLELGIPVVVGVEGATEILKDGQVATVDGRRGLVYEGEARVL